MRDALDACRDEAERAAAVPADAHPQRRHAAAQALAGRLFALRGAYETAAGEPWPDDLPEEQVLRAERAGHRLLARLTS